MEQPLLRVYLHYSFDLWVNVWRQKWAQGEVVIIRYADDSIAGFQYQTDADRFLKYLRERLATFGLELHLDKTRRVTASCCFPSAANPRHSSSGLAEPRRPDCDSNAFSQLSE